MNPVAQHFPVGRESYPVEPGNRACAGEARPWRKHKPPAIEYLHRTASCRPLVEIAHQDLRHVWVRAVQVREDRADLIATPNTREIEMRPHNAKHPTAIGNIRTCRATRFQHGKVKSLAVGNLHVAPDQNSIAMPADASRPLGDRHGQPWSVVQQGPRQHAGALAKPHVCLLQSDHVSIDFTKD